MYITHHFAHPETLTRARTWFAQLGFKPHQIETHAEGVPRLAMSVGPHELATVALMINVVERADTDGFPSFWELARRPHGVPVAGAEDPSPAEMHQPHATAIGWHPCD